MAAAQSHDDLAPVRPAWPLQAACVAAVVLPLLALRIYQMLSLSALLYNPEYLYSADLMLDVHQGEGLGPYLSLRGLESLAYGPQQQGPMAVAVGSALISLVTGPNIWALMATSLLGEALAVGLLVLVLLRTCGPAGAVLGSLPWLLAPGPVVVRHLMPFGNHAEFMAIPLAAALFLAVRAVERRPWWHWFLPLALFAAGVFLYRLNLSALVALWGVALLTRQLRVALAGTAAAVGATVAAWGGVILLHGWGVVGASAGGANSALPPLAEGVGRLVGSLGIIHGIFPAAPASLGIRWPYLWLLTAGLGAGIAWTVITVRQRRVEFAVLWFAVLWAAITLALGLLDGNPRPFHHINALGALFLVAALMQAPGIRRWVRRGAAVVLVGLACCGLIDNLALCDRQEAASNLDYDGLALYHHTSLQDLDSDDLDYLERMIREGRGDAFTEELAWLTELNCDGTDIHDWVTGRVPDLAWGSCRCWPRGELARRIVDAGDTASHVDMEQLGRFAWVACNRDLPSVERTLQGLPPGLFEVIMAGARDEAVQQSGF